MTVDQVTRERKKAGCVGCGTVVAHVQIAEFTKGSGFKVYRWIPIGHRRPDGTSCTYLAAERNQVWGAR